MHRIRVFMLICITLLPCVACNIGSQQRFLLRVPYRAQERGSLDCGPASVLMWRLYDGLSEISQSVISESMGGTCFGTSEQKIADAVNEFTLTRDAIWDLSSGIDPAGFMSRQITSIDTLTPVIAIINGGFHAGVVNGGIWSQLEPGLYQWDSVYFHDPDLGPNVVFSASAWIDASCAPGTPCSQIISVSASGLAQFNLTTFGPAIRVRGSSGSPGGGPIDP
ncbi:MAG: hypothetical protein D6696_16650 [Acidobacteria bacterium]|nr:MAG: hypothetical protein D6696_16650 [Acidobacteriota bacterium]